MPDNPIKVDLEDPDAYTREVISGKDFKERFSKFLTEDLNIKKLIETGVNRYSIQDNTGKSYIVSIQQDTLDGQFETGQEIKNYM